MNPESAPIAFIPPDDPNEKVEPGMALCLSGGGYRAMVFHLGCLIRLNEFGLLQQLKRVSSVSGGSITAGVLGLRWKELDFQNGIARKLTEKVIDPIRTLAGSHFATSCPSLSIDSHTK